MTTKSWIYNRIRLLELAIEDSLQRIASCGDPEHNKNYIKHQRTKQRKWQKEIDNLKQNQIKGV